MNWARIAATNSTFAIGGVSSQFYRFLMRINISGKNPAHRQVINRYSQW